MRAWHVLALALATIAHAAITQTAIAQMSGNESVVPPPRTPAIASAVLSDHVYSLNIPLGALVTGIQARALPAPPGYRVVAALNNPTTGFQGASYQNERTGQVYVVYRGTDAPLGRDGIADAGIAAQRGSTAGAVFHGVARAIDIGTRSDLGTGAYHAAQEALQRQLNDAQQLTDHSLQTFGRDKATVAGHSLGGAIAQVESARTGIAANTFNAPGMRDYIAKEYPQADVSKIANHNRGDDVIHNAEAQPGFSYTYPSVDSGVVIRGPDGSVIPDGRITATPAEAVLVGLDRSSAVANHAMSDFKNTLRAGAVPVDPPTFQPLQGEASPVQTESQMRDRFNAMAQQNQAVAAQRHSTINESPTAPGVAYPLAPMPSPFALPPVANAMGGTPSARMSTPASPPVAAPPSSTPPKTGSLPAAETHGKPPAKVCNKTYKAKTGCHPGHDEKAHPGGCHC